MSSIVTPHNVAVAGMYVLDSHTTQCGIPAAGMSSKAMQLYKVPYLNENLRIFLVEWDRPRLLIEEGAFLHMRDVFQVIHFKVIHFQRLIQCLQFMNQSGSEDKLYHINENIL